MTAGPPRKPATPKQAAHAAASTSQPGAFGIERSTRACHYQRQPRGSERAVIGRPPDPRLADSVLATSGWDMRYVGGFAGSVHWSCSTEESPKRKANLCR